MLLFDHGSAFFRLRESLIFDTVPTTGGPIIGHRKKARGMRTAPWGIPSASQVGGENVVVIT